MPDTTSIIAGKGLLEIAIEFQNLMNKLNGISNSYNCKSKIMESKDFYDGINRENLDLANHAAAQHLNNLKEFYGLCFAYIMYAYNNMIGLDKALAEAIQKAYIEEHYDK